MIKPLIMVPALIAGTSILLASCASSRAKEESTSKPIIINARIEKGGSDLPIGGEARALPKARIYKMNRDLSNYVPIQMTPQGEIISFPGPGDLSESAMPVKLDGGWWLDRRGIGPNTQFTDYTYREYMNLPAPPSIEDLKAHRLHGAEITEIAELPMTASEAAANVAEVNKLISEGLPGCTYIKR